ncbi:protocatechuate 3,4-dioxygenase subunit alpha [Streptomyces sp. RS10V-4]|uniref:protocatechuate 3,4-dioxygenase subunit alpha n=1 Tax=Streptomyces rhizoryzae TaxID=2932493 RepID=UPI0020041976|nr:protocatechuate 3,4-dioxygenase subunit alpha [Streptomyces rhizoryzae]MCK7625534.1 protocatechuate 3,4-dioxygenase subunit alpha [Streptomyces rhizoryzae]
MPRTAREPLAATPAQTIGPFFGHALPFPGGDRIAPEGDPGAVTLHGRVRDGDGAPVPDALLEFWRPGPDAGPPRPDPATGAPPGRGGPAATGFGRVPTDAAGHYAVHTPLPAARPDAAPHLALCVHARGLLHPLFTRVYFGGPAALAADPLLARLPAERARTLLARPDGPGRHRFDIQLRQPADGRCAETVFLAFR